MIYIDSLKDLAYSISFKEEDNGLKAILDAEKNIDKNLKNVIASSTKMGNNFNTAGGNANKVTDALADALIKSKETTTGVNAIAEASKKTTGIWKDANGRLRDVNGRFVKLKDSVDNVSSSTEKASKNTEDIGAKANKTKGVFNKLKDVIVSINSKLKGTGKETENTGNKGADTLKNLAKVAGGAFTAKKMFDFEKKVVDVYQKYDDQMRRVQAVSGTTGKETEKLRKKASELGETTRFSATQAGEGMEALARAGWKTDQILDGIGPSLTFASANALDLGTATSIVSNGLSQFGLKAKDTNMFTDVLSTTAAAANTDIEGLGEALKYAGPVAGTLNYSIQDISVAMGLMANKAITGSQAGTTLRSAISKLTTPLGESADILKHFGINVRDSNGKAKPFLKLVGEMRTKLSKLDNVQKAQFASTVFGQEAMSGMLAVLNATPEEFDKMTKAIKKCNGQTKKMADEMDGGLGGAIAGTQSAWEGFLLKIGESQDNSLIDFFNKLAQSIRDIPVESFANKIGNFFNWVLDNKDGIIVAFGAILGSIMAYKTISTIVTIYEHWESITKLLTLAHEGLNFVMKKNPVGLIVFLIGSLILTLIEAYKHSEAFRQACDNLWQSMRNGAEGAINFVIDKLNWAIGKINSFINLLNKIPGVNLGNIDNIGHVNFTKDDGKGLTPKRNLLPKKSNGITLQLPGVPQMATGGIVTGPTHALIGEGKESEVVFPLSKLENFLSNRENKAQLDVLSNIKPIIEPQIAINNVSDPREQVPMQSIVNNTTNNSNVTNTRQIENNKSDKPVVINININGADNPKNIAQQVRETIEDIFATASIQLGYTDV